jgi:hypothetical protein
MSYESNDERIERLEQKFAELLSVQKAMLRLNQDQVQRQKTVNICLLKEAVLLKNGLDAIARYLISISSIIDEAERRVFLDGISRWESNSEKLEAMIEELEKSPPESLPPDEPLTPGPA